MCTEHRAYYLVRHSRTTVRVFLDVNDIVASVAVIPHCPLQLGLHKFVHFVFSKGLFMMSVHLRMRLHLEASCNYLFGNRHITQAHTCWLCLRKRRYK